MDAWRRPGHPGFCLSYHQHWNGYAGELGHTILQVDGPTCSCGNKGCWEALSSGTAIARTAKARVQAGSAILDLAQGDREAISAKTVFTAFEMGDSTAEEILRDSAHWSALGIYNLSLTLNPERVAIGGGVGLSSKRYLAMIQDEVEAFSRKSLSMPELVFASLGDQVGVVGSAAVARASLKG